MSAAEIKTDSLNSRGEKTTGTKKSLWTQAQKDKIVLVIQLFLSILVVLIFIRKSFRELIYPVGSYRRKYARKLEKREFRRKDKIRKLEHKLERKTVKQNNRGTDEIAS